MGAEESAQAPQLIVTLAGRQHRFPSGRRVVVARDPDADVVSVNPLVSRTCHGVLVGDEHGAVYTDMSRRGTFLNGQPLRGPLRIDHSLELRLGDPATGEVLGITPPLTAAQLERNRTRPARRKRRALAGAVVVLLAAGVTTGALLWPASSRPRAAAPAPTRPSATVRPVDPLALAQAATVRLLLGSPNDAAGWGSGTVVDPHGLILTNAHVAQPQAPGQAVALGAPGSTLPDDPPYLTVELTSGQSSPAVARYRARPVAVDGYRDLAVVRIYADASGRPVDPASLSLPALRIGSSAALRLGQPLTVLGFPGISESDSITLTTGVLSTFVPDPLRHVPGERFELETTARVAHGNSGGAAVDAAGLLIGVPSLEVTGDGGDVSWRLRGADQALPLLAAARAGRPYRSAALTERSGTEHMVGVGTGPDAASACAGSGGPGTGELVWVGVRYTGLGPGEDVALGLRLPDGSSLAERTGMLPQGTADRAEGCFAFPVRASELRLAALPAGTWTAQLYAGPGLTEVGGTVPFPVSTT